MLKVISKENCSRCIMTKNILENKGVDFEYITFENLTKEDQDKYIETARKSRLMSFPLIVKDEILVQLQEVI